ncbi:hypothetical protein ACG0Z6_04470 [Roseateles sp. BYS180W]|uniref:ABC-type transport auxiliary lipoprotein component domain-containing protein n=1 Tax=Roseateles rivi TaxID=3299028 RepID=A0ABW7FT77_9BURK
MSALPRPLLLPLALLLALLSGCATPLEPESARLSTIERLQLSSWMPAALRRQVALGKVQSERISEAWFGTSVNTPRLRVVLDDLLRDTGLNAPDPKLARYELHTKLLSQDASWPQPGDSKATLYLEFRLVQREGERLVYLRQMRVHQTLGWERSWTQPGQGGRLALEAAMRQSLSTLLRELAELPIEG